MGILYNAVKRNQESTRQIVIKELNDLGIKESRDGRDVNDLDYYEILNELALVVIKRG